MIEYEDYEKIIFFLLFFISYIIIFNYNNPSVNAAENYSSNYENYSTEAIIEEIIITNDIQMIYLFNDINKGIIYYQTYSELFNELKERVDAADVLYYMLTSEDINDIELQAVSFLISQYDIYTNLSTDEQNIVDSYLYDAPQSYNTASAIVLEENSEYVYTPNGSEIEVLSRDYITLDDELDLSQIESYAASFGVLNTLGVPTHKYNCHSYAWYNQNKNNENYYWMNNPEGYYLDDSYVESDGEKNDILCYYTFDSFYYLDGTYAGYAITNAHSAIITSPDNVNFDVNDPSTLDEVTVDSKWGALGLYSHKGNDCPYLSDSSGYVQIGNNIYYMVSSFSHIKAYTPKTNASYTLSNSNYQISEIVTITSSNDHTNNYEMYELNIKDSGSFEFNISSTSNLDVRLYDEHMQLVEYDNLSIYSNVVRFVKDFACDKKYYLRVAYYNDSSIGTISTYIHEACSGCNSLYRDEVVLNCQTEPYEDSLYLQQNQTIIYELDLECDTRYDFEVESPNLLSVGLYDENMTLVSDFLYFQGTNNNYYYFNVQDLEEGRYHIKVNLASGSSSCNINVTLDHRPTSPEEILVNEPVDVLEHLHYSSNAYYFMRNKPGIYEVVLTGISSNGTIIYPEGTITIVSGDNVVQKYVFTEEEYDNPATSLNGSNTMTWLVDDYANYYINIEISSTGLTSLQLEVRELETFTLSASDEFSEISQLVNGDKFEILDVERTGEYNVQATYTGSQTDDMLFVILRKNSDGLFEEVDGGLFNNTTNFETDVLLNTGEQIYIGYFNGNGNGTFSLNIERNVSNTFSLMTDPNGNVTVGSEVSLNNGEYGGTTLTQGYTRIVYLGIDAPYIQSRTQYNWYTTDSSVAIVSAYGTVTATATWTGSQTSKTVVIRAVYKSNPTIVGEITLTVYKDTSTTIEVLTQYGMDVRGDGSQGTEVTVLNESAISIGVTPYVEIHKGYTRYICLGSDSPSNIIQHFTWSIDRQDGETGNATVSQYGVITGTTEGYITIKGVYKYNPRYVIYITVKVL